MKFLTTIPLALAALTLVACSDSTKKTFGLEANPPDAFDVGTQAPLSLPPELGTLPAPTPGAPRPQQQDAAAAGADVVAPANAITAAPTAATPGEQALLSAAGPAPPPGIRATVNSSALVASKPPGFVASLMGSGPAAQPTVDPAAEQKRIEQNAALGQPVTQGATPQLQDGQISVLGHIFNMF
jgi:hypothetical protein